MAGRGLRSILQPVLFVGIASLLHGILFLIPGGGPGRRDPGTSRGIRVKTYVEGPPAPATPRSPLPVSREETPTEIRQPPATVRELHFSAAGSKTASGENPDIGSQSGGSGPRAAAQGTASQSEWERYKDKLGSSGVQGWAKESAQRARQGWKGTGAGRGTDGWAKMSKTAEAGSGKGASGTGAGGAIFMDPRVQMIVTSYPATGIERRYTPVRYPDLKIKRHEYTSGWWYVYIQIRTDKDGKIIRSDVLRPDTDGPLERQFVAQVTKEIAKWFFDPREAEIHVDVRFYVE